MRPLPIEPSEILKNERLRKKAELKCALKNNDSIEKQKFLTPDSDKIPASLYSSAPNNIEKFDDPSLSMGDYYFSYKISVN